VFSLPIDTTSSGFRNAVEVIENVGSISTSVDVHCAVRGNDGSAQRFETLLLWAVGQGEKVLQSISLEELTSPTNRELSLSR